MIIRSSSPCRISLFGGGIDIKPYREIYGAHFINFAINIRQQVTISYYPTDAEIAPNNYFIHQILKHNKLPDAIATQEFNGRIEAGLGSSGALTIAVLANIYKYGNRIPSSRIVFEGEHIENDICNNPTGIQDHVSAYYGGFNAYKIEKLAIYKIPCNTKFLDYVLLFDTGIKRTHQGIQKPIMKLTSEKIKYLHKIKDSVQDGFEALQSLDIEKVAYYIQIYWNMKKKLNAVTNTQIDKIYYNGLINGARAGKLLGAGEGGYMMFIVDPKDQENFIRYMEKEYAIKHIPYRLEPHGIEVIVLNQ